MSRNIALDIQDAKDLLGISEFIKDRLYFVTFRNTKERSFSLKFHYFCIDELYIYLNFAGDFGPLCLSMVYRYCDMLNRKLNASPSLKNKTIIHYTSLDQKKRANAAFLIGCYSIIYLKFTPTEVQKILQTNKIPFTPFQDASDENSKYKLDLQDCFNAIHKARQLNFFDFDDFDVEQSDKYERIQFGDINWIVPEKFLAFSGPNTAEPNTCYHPPEFYLDYFLKNNIQLVIRLNHKNYDESKFTDAGIDHVEFYFPDGTSPPKDILCSFLKTCENYKGPIAVHCKAGLGRTGCLIGAYLIKHYKMSAMEAIAWMRICRPGCVIGSQQDWLKDVQPILQNVGEKYRSVRLRNSNIQKHRFGIYSKKRSLNKPAYDVETASNMSKQTNKENSPTYVRRIQTATEPKRELPKNFVLANIKRPLTNLCRKKIIITPKREPQADRLLLAKTSQAKHYSKNST